jgi:sugar lactone lactonase YvrE
MDEHKILRRVRNGAMAVHADLSNHAVGPANDMVLDAAGRAFVGYFGFDLDNGAPFATADLLRVDPNGTVSVAASGLFFPNGAVIFDDTLIVAETAGNRISAFNLYADGRLGPRRDWACFGELPRGTAFGEVISQLLVAPDGICVDSEGALWIADALGGRALRVLPGGEIVSEINIGVGVYACTLGGDDGRTLFLCTAPSFLAHERRDTRDARMLSIKVEVQG